MLRAAQHIVLWIVALSILNTSIDIIDVAYPVHPESRATGMLEYNEIESIVEYLIDETSGHEKQLPDTKGNDQKSLLKKVASFDFSMPVKKEKIVSVLSEGMNKKHSIPDNATLLPAGFTTRLIQPPDIA